MSDFEHPMEEELKPPQHLQPILDKVENLYREEVEPRSKPCPIAFPRSGIIWIRTGSCIRRSLAPGARSCARRAEPGFIAPTCLPIWEEATWAGRT